MDTQIPKAFQIIPYGIYALITQEGSRIQAMIVSWVSQVSYSPPLLMVALRHTRQAIPAIQKTGGFSLSLLGEEQKSVVARLKNPLTQSQSSGLFEQTGETGSPFLKEALVSWQCRVVSMLQTGDHVVFISEVQTVSLSREGKPLTTTDYGKTYIGQS